MIDQSLDSLIEQRLKQELKAVLVQIKDRSAAHQQHQESKGGGHFSITISSPLFENKPLIERHRLVYATLADLIKSNQIHALSINALVPSA